MTLRSALGLAFGLACQAKPLFSTAERLLGLAQDAGGETRFRIELGQPVLLRQRPGLSMVRGAWWIG